MATREVTDRADRQVGWLITLCSLVALTQVSLVGHPAPPLIGQWDDFAPWWNAGGLLVMSVFVFAAALGRWLPMRLLRAVWRTVPLLVILLQLLSFAAFQGADAELIPWIWLLEPTAVSLLVLAFRPPIAFGIAFLSGTTVALSAWIFTGSVPDTVAMATPIHMSNIGFTVIFYAMRNGLARLHESEDAARHAAEQEARTTARTKRRTELSRFVHDEVLSVFTAAMLFRGKPPEILRQEARHALTMLDASTPEPDAEALDGRAAAAQLRARLERVTPSARIVADGDDETVPASAVACVIDAMSEALRNAARHSQADRIDVTARFSDGGIRATVNDDGIGFDPRRMIGRLGVADSIFARMLEIGGEAEMLSAPGQGTEVRLTWMP